MFRVEDRHWWFSGKRRLVGAILSKLSNHGNIPAGARILDVGCGTGGMHLLLQQYGKITAVDGSPLALEWNQRRGIATLARGSLPNLPFQTDAFDFVTIFDVLYHRNVGDDAVAAAELYRVVKPGGILLVTDSALPILTGPHDVSMHGARRYTKRSIRTLLMNAGFEVERVSYMNFLLAPAAIPWRLLQKWFGGGEAHGNSDVKPSPAWINFILNIIYAFEAVLIRAFDLPIGTSIAAVAKKPARQ
ncbi:MAG: class I SAM-dependent methyltransferase [Planctomycetota bacterium]